MTWDEWRGTAAVDLRRRLARLSGLAASRAGAAARRAFREASPRRTGALRRSVRVKRTRGRGGSAWVLTVGPTVPYRWVAFRPGVGAYEAGGRRAVEAWRSQTRSLVAAGSAAEGG